MRVLVTGGAGFIGSHFCALLLGETKHANEVSRVTVLDSLTYASDMKRIEGLLELQKFKFVHGDICNSDIVSELVSNHDIVFNFAAESHVDNSLNSPNQFIQTNALGVQVILNCLNKTPDKRLVQVSTDEVYGEVLEGVTTESAPLKPSSPYSASKAAAELLIFAANRSFGQEYVITRGSNTFGIGQHSEKVIPRFIRSAIMGQAVPMYGDGLQIREWLHVSDHVMGIWLAGQSTSFNQVFNLGSGYRISNRELVEQLNALSPSLNLSINNVTDRPGHDRRYAIDSAKAKKLLGFAPKKDFREGLKEVIDYEVARASD